MSDQCVTLNRNLKTTWNKSVQTFGYSSYDNFDENYRQKYHSLFMDLFSLQQGIKGFWPVVKSKFLISNPRNYLNPTIWCTVKTRI